MQVVLSIGAAIVAFTSVTIGAAYGLENSTKLYALTYMLVCPAISGDFPVLKSAHRGSFTLLLQCCQDLTYCDMTQVTFGSENLATKQGMSTAALKACAAVCISVLICAIISLGLGGETTLLKKCTVALL